MTIVAQRARVGLVNSLPSLDQGRWSGAMLLCASVHNVYTHRCVADIPLLQSVALPVALLAAPGWLRAVG